MTERFHFLKLDFQKKMNDNSINFDRFLINYGHKNSATGGCKSQAPGEQKSRNLLIGSERKDSQ